MHQAADALSRLRTTGTHRTPIGDEIPVLCITSAIRPGEVRSIYMKNYEAVNDKEGIRLPKV